MGVAGDRHMKTRDRSIRILHLVPADGIGGVEVAAKSMLGHDDANCDFHLLFIEAVSSISRGMLAIASLGLANLAAFRQARAIDPDVILCSLWRSVPLALILRVTLNRTKLVFFIHSDVTVHWLDTLFSRVAIRSADAIWGDSKATLAARAAPVGRARVISFVTDRLVAPDQHGGEASFVSWGRLHHLKGIDRSIRLIALLARRGLDVRYDIYGPDGGAQGDLEALAVELGVDNRIRFLGPVARVELKAIAARHRFFLQLSRAEGMCMAAVEAMQLGLVPVATSVGELGRYVRSGETGVTVVPDMLEETVDDLQRLIDDDDTRRRLSQAAARYWLEAPLYAQDVCDAARALVGSTFDRM